MVYMFNIRSAKVLTAIYFEKIIVALFEMVPKAESTLKTV